MSTMKPALWFSRHQPTAEQIADAAKRGYELTEIERGIEAGSVNILTAGDVFRTHKYLGAKGQVVFGVIPVPLRALWIDAPSERPERVYEAWNIRRTPEGGEPTFEHFRWVRTF